MGTMDIETKIRALTEERIKYVFEIYKTRGNDWLFSFVKLFLNHYQTFESLSQEKPSNVFEVYKQHVYLALYTICTNQPSQKHIGEVLQIVRQNSPLIFDEKQQDTLYDIAIPYCNVFDVYMAISSGSIEEKKLTDWICKPENIQSVTRKYIWKCDRVKNERSEQLRSLLVTHVGDYLIQNVSFHKLMRSQRMLKFYGGEQGKYILQDVIPLCVEMLARNAGQRQHFDTLAFRVKHTKPESPEYWSLLEQILEQHPYSRNAHQFVFKCNEKNKDYKNTKLLKDI